MHNRQLHLFCVDHFLILLCHYVIIIINMNRDNCLLLKAIYCKVIYEYHKKVVKMKGGPWYLVLEENKEKNIYDGKWC
jgi:hypothetical protein